MGRKKIYTAEELIKKRRAYQREYTKRDDVKIKISKTRKLWKEKNKDKLNSIKREYRKNLRKKDHTHFVGERLKWSAKKRGLQAPYTNMEYREWYNSQKQICGYCNSDVNIINKFLLKKGVKVSFRGLGIDRKDSSRGYLFDNMLLACYVCNVSKQAIFSHDDFKEIAMKYIVPKIKSL